VLVTAKSCHNKQETFGWHRPGGVHGLPAEHLAALKELDPAHGEIKSMRTAAAARGRGLGSGLLRHLIDESVRRGYARLMTREL
jgi:ribosomal protein S18 acetylase RimI-like enzyme